MGSEPFPAATAAMGAHQQQQQQQPIGTISDDGDDEEPTERDQKKQKQEQVTANSKQRPPKSVIESADKNSNNSKRTLELAEAGGCGVNSAPSSIEFGQNGKSKTVVRVLDPSGDLYYHWSVVVSFAFLYNFWSLSYRFAFREIDFDTVAFWFTLDYSADLIYVLDLVVNFHTGYLEDGVLQRNIDKISQHYRECTLFYLDCFCLLPLDVLYLSIGFNSILRCTRLVKIYKFWSYVDRTERHTNYPNVFRTFTLVHYILVIFHWNACLFHMISKNRIIDIENLYKINDNRCDDILCQYLHAFYWSTLALTTIGDLPKPRTKGEYLYIIVELVFGLFLFASVLGHVANIVTNVSAARKEFQAKLDAVKTFMRMRRVSDELQNKVIRWFDYLWISQKSSDEERSVACLPDRLKAEIAIHVHLDTLKRVDIFQNTEAGFLCELVLRLKLVLFSPGDYVCRKNEVGHEMYIVSRGILEVVSNEGKLVVATLKAGSYFGEISVLNVGLAGNKRTASVRSVGYSDLFCLNKRDLWDVLKNYPNAEARIRARAEERLSKLDINQQQQQLGASQNSSAGGLMRSRTLTAATDSDCLAGIDATAGSAAATQRRLVCSSASRYKPQVRRHLNQVVPICCINGSSSSGAQQQHARYQRPPLSVELTSGGGLAVGLGGPNCCAGGHRETSSPRRPKNNNNGGELSDYYGTGDAGGHKSRARRSLNERPSTMGGSSFLFNSINSNAQVERQLAQHSHHPSLVSNSRSFDQAGCAQSLSLAKTMAIGRQRDLQHSQQRQQSQPLQQHLPIQQQAATATTPRNSLCGDLSAACTTSEVVAGASTAVATGNQPEDQSSTASNKSEPAVSGAHRAGCEDGACRPLASEQTGVPLDSGHLNRAGSVDDASAEANVVAAAANAAGCSAALGRHYATDYNNEDYDYDEIYVGDEGDYDDAAVADEYEHDHCGRHQCSSQRHQHHQTEQHRYGLAGVSQRLSSGSINGIMTGASGDNCSQATHQHQHQHQHRVVSARQRTGNGGCCHHSLNEQEADCCDFELASTSSGSARRRQHQHHYQHEQEHPHQHHYLHGRHRRHQQASSMSAMQATIVSSSSTFDRPAGGQRQQLHRTGWRGARRFNHQHGSGQQQADCYSCCGDEGPSHLHTRQPLTPLDWELSHAPVGGLGNASTYQQQQQQALATVTSYRMPSSGSPAVVTATTAATAVEIAAQAAAPSGCTGSSS